MLEVLRLRLVRLELPLHDVVGGRVQGRRQVPRLLLVLVLRRQSYLHPGHVIEQLLVVGREHLARRVAGGVWVVHFGVLHLPQYLWRSTGRHLTLNQLEVHFGRMSLVLLVEGVGGVAGRSRHWSQLLVLMHQIREVLLLEILLGLKWRGLLF